jgi:dihydrolipoamide dehydrogenase
MASPTEIRVPDIGDFKGVSVIEVMVKPGDSVALEQGLCTIETDKSAMDVPATAAGKVLNVKVKVGDKVSQGDLICTVDAEATIVKGARGKDPDATVVPQDPDATVVPAARSASAPNLQVATPLHAAVTAARVAPRYEAAPRDMFDTKADIECQVVVLGSGPGGYAAAFRAADLGLKTVLVERAPVLGGVCLNVGCIPSKALLHAAKVIEDAHAMAEHGITFGTPKIDLAKLRGFKDGAIKKSTNGLDMMAKQRKVEVVTGTGRFLDAHHLAVDLPPSKGGGGRKVIGFEQCIIAAGSEPTKIPGLPEDPRIMDSTGALELVDIPKRLLVVGGGIIGLEMACVYDALGTKVTVVELTDTLIPGADRDVVRPLEKRIKERYEAILLGTKVTAFKASKKGIEVTFDSAGKTSTDTFDRVLVAVGRRPNGKAVGAAEAGITVDERGFIPSDKQMRTNLPHVYSIGDIRGNPMLAHKAAHEGHIAAEVAAGHKRFYDARAIPSIAYTDPEVAWVGMTEGEAKAAGLKVGKGVFPWAASGRARAMAQDAGQTKLLFDESNHRLIGAACTGVNAGELLGELTLAIEMGASAEDIALTIHAHPTLHESVGLAAETFEGTVTDLYAPKKPVKPG